MRHGTATVITRIRPDRLAHLEALLDAAARARTALFTGVPGLHFARWAIIDLTVPGHGEEDRRLLFATDATFTDAVEGPEALDVRLVHGLVSWLTKLHEHDAPGASLFDGIYGACEGYPEAGLAAPDEVEAYLLRHRVDTLSRHVDFAYRFQSPEELRESVDVLRAVEQHLDARIPQLAETPWRGRREDLAALHGELRDHVPSVSATLFEPEWRWRLAAARASAALATCVYPWVKYFQWRLRREGPAPREPSVQPAPGRLTPWSAPMVQNPMVHVVRITGGTAGLKLARQALRSVDLRLRRYVVGLDHIQTLHCARWVLYPDGGDAGPHHLIFLANHDDSRDAFIDALIDHADVRGFLERIWSQTEGFPESFKAWLRAHEVPTRVWYSAALDGGPRQRHSVLLLHNALRLRELLTRERIDRPLRDWAARRAFAAFLSRGACDSGRALLRPVALVLHTLSALRRRKTHVLTPAGVQTRFPSEHPATA